MLTRCVYSMSAFLDYASIDLTEGTLTVYKSSLKLFFKHFQKHPSKLQMEDVESYVSFLVQRKLSASIINSRLSALTCYYEYLRRKKIFTLDFNIMKDVKHPPILVTEQLVVKSAEVLDLIKKIECRKNNSFTNLRNVLMILIAATTGARVHEISNLHVEHLDIKNKTITFYKTKNKKPRVLFLSEPVISRLDNYLIERENIMQLNKSESSFLFSNKDGGNIRVAYLCAEMREYEKLYGVKIRWHAIRRGFATDLANNGVEIEKISKALGHSTVEITAQRYIQTGNKELFKALEHHPLIASSNIKNNNKETVEMFSNCIAEVMSEMKSMRVDFNNALESLEYKKASTTL